MRNTMLRQQGLKVVLTIWKNGCRRVDISPARVVKRSGFRRGNVDTIDESLNLRYLVLHGRKAGKRSAELFERVFRVRHAGDLCERSRVRAEHYMPGVRRMSSCMGPFVRDSMLRMVHRRNAIFRPSVCSLNQVSNSVRIKSCAARVHRLDRYGRHLIWVSWVVRSTSCSRTTGTRVRTSRIATISYDSSKYEGAHAALLDERGQGHS